MQKTVFVVDDSDTNLSMAEEALEDSYNVMTVPSARTMFRLLDRIRPDLILLDIEMPDMDGFEAISVLKSADAHAGIPVIFLTSYSDASVEARGFDLGAVDFIIKPFYKAVLLNRIKMHLDVDDQIHSRTTQLRRLQNGIVHVLSNMVDNRDKATSGHVERAAEYVRILAEGMKECGLYAEQMRGWDMDITVAAASLHDIGKIAVSDLILNKPERLTPTELIKMQTHVPEGERIIDRIISRTGEDPFLQNARQFVSYHHERWDGTGYPYRLAGHDIPLQGRLMAIPDTFDALVTSRPYKAALSAEEAAHVIMADAGKQFDPSIAEVFFATKDRFKPVE